MRDSLNNTHKWMRYSNTENHFISEFALVFSCVDEILGGMIIVFCDVRRCVFRYTFQRTMLALKCLATGGTLNSPPLLVTMKELITVKHN
jgi:hypothetical protein